MQIDGTNSRTEDLLVTGVEETKKPLSRVEAILRGEDIKPQSRIEKALKEGGGGSTSNDVTQTSINDSERHRLILSNSGTDNTEVAGVYKNNKLTFNPKASRLFIGYNTLSTGDTSINGSIQLQQKDQVSETSTVLTALTGIASDSPIFDVTLIEDTWDGTNHSLKDAIANAGGGSEQIMFINGEAYQDKSHVTLNKTFAEIYDFVKNSNKIAVIIVPNLVFSGNNYFMLSNVDNASSSFPALLSFSYIGNRVEIDSVRSQLTFKDVKLAIDSTEDNIARVINDSNTTPLYVEVSGTLLAGETNLRITNGHIKTTSTIDYYTSIFGVNPTNAVVTSGLIVLTFEAQQTDMQVKVRVS